VDIADFARIGLTRTRFDSSARLEIDQDATPPTIESAWTSMESRTNRNVKEIVRLYQCGLPITKDRKVSGF
jgi:hypothetical protein